MLTCLSRSVSVRSHGRLASLKHPVLSPPPLWNTPNKTPPKSTTNSYSLKLLRSFLPSFSFHSSASFLPKSVQISSVPLSISTSSSFVWSAIPLSLSLSLPLALFPFLSLFHESSFPNLNCPFLTTTLLITKLIFFHHIHQLFHNQIHDPYNFFPSFLFSN